MTDETKNDDKRAEEGDNVYDVYVENQAIALVPLLWTRVQLNNIQSPYYVTRTEHECAPRRMKATTVAEEHPFVYVPMQAKISTNQDLPLPFTQNDSINEIPPQRQPSNSFYDIPASKWMDSYMRLPDLNMLSSIDEEAF
ncbi:hypothetical protein QQ045_022358 [Rhodiola kirilowii]